MATSEDDDIDDNLPDSDDSDTEDRPNRWAGPSSTWQQLNSAEIDTITALNEIRNEDLSIHLYNAFNLKQRRNASRGAEALTIDPDVNAVFARHYSQDEHDWRPPRSWTAWPMPAHRVPRQEFVKRTDQSDEKYAFRKVTRDMPSTALEECIAAIILKAAKNKFYARPWADKKESDEDAGAAADSELDDGDEGSDVESDTSASNRARSRSRSVKQESGDERDAESHAKMDIDGGSGKDEAANTKAYVPPKERPLKPTVATDDELSYMLLRPTARHVLAKLDTTLTILHHAQEATFNYPSDSADSDASEVSRRSRSRSRQPSRSRAASQQRRSSVSREASQARDSAPPEGLAEGVKRVGRPRKNIPRLDGENDREYAIRVARLQKKPKPKFSDDESGADSSARPATEASGEESSRKTPRGRRKRTRTGSPVVNKDGSAPRGKGTRRSGLRDWKDILGAAALAGFPAEALDRTARRCADLFGQTMELQTVVEAPHGQNVLNKATEYKPGMPQPPLLGDEDYYEEEPYLRMERRSRASSLAPDAMSEDDRRSRSRSVSRPGRSRSGSVPGSLFCTFGDCPRSVEGFVRRQNLYRHLKLVHGIEGDELLPVDVDSEDEMYGAVHVDGFLKPIKVRSGWRGDDIGDEPRKRGRQRGRSRKATPVSDVGMGGDDRDSQAGLADDSGY